jgi:serine/threonine kinase 16
MESSRLRAGIMTDEEAGASESDPALQHGGSSGSSSGGAGGGAAGGSGGVGGGVWAAVEALLSSCGCMSRRIRVNSRTLRVLRQLAEGGYSFVFLVEDLRTRHRYAVKQVLAQSPEARRAVREEVEVHLAFTHPNVAPLEDYAFTRRADGYETAYLLMPLYDRGSLQDNVSRRHPRGPYIDELTALRIFRGVCAAVAEFHHHQPAPWAHRDICPRNIMLDDRGAPVLIDFGSCRTARVPITSRHDALALQEEAQTNSSMPYRAPELWDVPTGTVVTEKSDGMSAWGE